MSFITDLFEGNFGNLGSDIAGGFKDFGSSFANQPGWAQGLEIALPAAAAAFVAPEVLPALFAEGGGGLAAAEGAGAGFDLATIGPGVAAGGEAAAGGGALSGLTAADVTFMDPALMGEAAATPFDVGAAPVPFTNMTLGGGFPQVEGGAGGGVFNFSPSTEFATGYPGVGGGGAAGGGATVAGADPAFAAPGITGGADGGVTPLTSFEGGIATPANPSAAGQFGTWAGAGGAPTPTPGIMDTLGAGMTKAAPWLGAAGLGYSLFQGYESQQAQKALQAQETAYQNSIAAAGQKALSAAGPMLSTGQALMTGGTVPAPVQAMLDNFRNAERARIIQGYGARNQTTDPTQNSALAQDLNAVDNQLLALRETIGNQMVTTANQMLQSGASATQIAAELPMMMQRLDMQLQQMTGNAIANFAAAMSGGTMKVAGQGSGTNLNLNLNTPGATNTQSLLGAQ